MGGLCNNGFVVQKLGIAGIINNSQTLKGSQIITRNVETQDTHFYQHTFYPKRNSHSSRDHGASL